MTDGSSINWEDIDTSLQEVLAEQSRTPLDGLALDSAPVRLYNELEERRDKIQARETSTVISQLVLKLTDTQMTLLTRFHEGVREGLFHGAAPLEAIRGTMYEEAELVERNQPPYIGVDPSNLHTSLYVIAKAYEEVYHPGVPLPPIEE